MEKGHFIGLPGTVIHLGVDIVVGPCFSRRRGRVDIVHEEVGLPTEVVCRMRI